MKPRPVQLKFPKDSAGKWRWQIKHSNGRILAASSESFASRSGAQRNLQRLKWVLDKLAPRFKQIDLSKQRSNSE